MAEFKYSNSAREMEVYGYDSVVKSACRMCHGGCGVLVYIKDGKAKKIAGDPDCPINHGTLCSKGIGSIQLAYHPDRLTYPVKRIGPKGSGKWERISWMKHSTQSRIGCCSTRTVTALSQLFSVTAQEGRMKPQSTVRQPLRKPERVDRRPFLLWAAYRHQHYYMRFKSNR